MKKFILFLLFPLSIFAEDAESLDDIFYADVVAQFVFPQGGGNLRQLSGAAVRLGSNLTDAFAFEGEVAALENKCAIAARAIYHLQGWETFGKLFGYERFDPFVLGGARGWINDGDIGPLIGVGALYYLDNSFAIKVDGDVTLGLDSQVETIYSLSIGLQYSF